LICHIIGSSFRKNLGTINPLGSKDSPEVKEMRISAIQVLLENLLIDKEQAKELNLPISKIEERGLDKGDILFILSDRIYNLILFLKTDILSRMLCNMKLLNCFP
jgi:hypothetical protein